MKILILNGHPNLNLLGRREPEIYGTQSLDELNRSIGRYTEETYGARGDGAAIELQFFQTNHEGQLIDAIQNSPRSYAGVVYNPAAHAHYSVALRDAIAAVSTPFVEVHLTDLKTREEFRHTSLISDVCIGSYTGKGEQSYFEALDALVAHLDKTACVK